MKLRVATWVLVSLACMTEARVASASKNSFFCAAAVSTGLLFQDGRWKSVEFDPSEQRFTISRWSSSEYAVYRLGNDKPDFVCFEYGLGGPISIDCKNDRESGVGFRFDEGTLRFHAYSIYGYVGGNDNVRPSLTIGTCSPIP
jgi:hypothetical protein